MHLKFKKGGIRKIVTLPFDVSILLQSEFEVFIERVEIRILLKLSFIAEFVYDFDLLILKGMPLKLPPFRLDLPNL